MKFSLITTLVMFLIYPLGAMSESIKLTLCNKTPIELFAAVGYQNKFGWQAEGWYKIKSSLCREPSFQATNRNIYVYAQGGSKSWGGKYEFCVDKTNEFHIKDSKNCRESLGFSQVGNGKSWSYKTSFTCTDCPQVSRRIGERRDVTSAVILHTYLDEKIYNACIDHCQGNRREGKLKQVLITFRGGSRHSVTVTASMKNAGHVDGPFGIGGGAGWSHTMDIEAQGILNSKTCMLTITKIRVLNDNLGLSGLARGEEGKTHKIQNCRMFT